MVNYKFVAFACIQYSSFPNRPGRPAVDPWTRASGLPSVRPTGATRMPRTLLFARGWPATHPLPSHCDLTSPVGCPKMEGLQVCRIFDVFCSSDNFMPSISPPFCAKLNLRSQYNTAIRLQQDAPTRGVCRCVKYLIFLPPLSQATS